MSAEKMSDDDLLFEMRSRLVEAATTLREGKAICNANRDGWIAHDLIRQLPMILVPIEYLIEILDEEIDNIESRS